MNLILSNARIDTDGWALIAPFGQHPKSRQVMQDGRVVTEHFLQVLDNEIADALVRNENTFFKRLKRAFVGVPVFVGHPDLKEHAPATLGNHGTKRFAGVMDNMRKGEHGLEGHFALTPDGGAAVENEGAEFVSVLWDVTPLENFDAPAGVMPVRPVKVLSVGLTAHPNISGVDSLANEQSPAGNSNPDPDQIMRDKIIGLLAGHGITLANATDDQLLAALQPKREDTLRPAILTALGLANTATDAEIVQAAEQGKANATALANAQTEHQTALANAIDGRIEARVDLAIAQGRMAVADRAARITALKASATLDKDLAALANEAVKFQTVTGQADASRVAAANANRTPREELFRLANEDTRYKGKDWSVAYNLILKDHPALAEQLKARPAAQ